TSGRTPAPRETPRECRSGAPRRRRSGRRRRCCRAGRTRTSCPRNRGPPAATPTRETRPASRWDEASPDPSLLEHLAQVGLQDRRRLLELLAEAGEVLQLADRPLGLAHALGGGVGLAAEEVGILPVDRHLGERLDLAFDAIELEADELGVLLRALEVVEPQLAHRDAVLQRLGDPLVVRLLRDLEGLALLLEPRRHLLLVHRLQEAIERRLRDEQPEEQPEQAVEARRRHAVARRRLVAGRAAHAGRDAAHLAAAAVQP